MLLLGVSRVQALAAEPDLLWSAGHLLTEMGAELAVAVTTTRSPLLDRLPVGEVLIGDLEDLERSAAVAGCDLLMTHSHGRQAAERLHKPLFRLGMPMFDRIGNAHICHVGYRGTRNFVYEVGNLLMEQIVHHHATDWPLSDEAVAAARGQAMPVFHSAPEPGVAHLDAVIGRMPPRALSTAPAA